MIDLILVASLLLVGGVLFWMQRSRIGVPAGQEADQTEINAEQTLIGAADPGYFWKLARPAGLSPDQAWPLFLGAKILLVLLLPLAGLTFLGFGGLGMALAALIGFFAPDAMLMYVRRERQKNIRRSLSFFLDLLVSLLQAGITLDEAFKRAARDGLKKDHPLAEEAALVGDELDIGRDRTAGFQALADRTGVRELRGLANALSLGLGAGTSVEATLKAQADLARAKRREEGMRRLSLASAEILLPLILCGFPVFMVMVFFPLAILLLQNLGAIGAALR